jgi:uncharacterized membrane protein YdjX (TVP38/TMEM64 family)
LLAGGLVGLILLGVLANWVSPTELISATETLVQALRNLGVSGTIIVGALQVFIAVTGILPASLLGVVAGAIYGFVPGFLLVAVSTMAGAMVAFSLTRSLFRPRIVRRLRIFGQQDKLRADRSKGRETWA